MLREHRIDHEGLRSKSWEEFAQPGAPKMNFVFTVCNQAAAETCPVWPGQPTTAHWGVPDPAAVTGAEEEQHRAFREAFLVLRRRIELFVALPPEKSGPASAFTKSSRGLGRTAIPRAARPCPNPQSSLERVNFQFPIPNCQSCLPAVCRTSWEWGVGDWELTLTNASEQFCSGRLEHVSDLERRQRCAQRDHAAGLDAQRPSVAQECGRVDFLRWRDALRSRRVCAVEHGEIVGADHPS